MPDIPVPALRGSAAAMALQAARLAALAQNENCPRLRAQISELSTRMAGQARAVAVALQGSRAI